MDATPDSFRVSVLCLTSPLSRGYRSLPTLEGHAYTLRILSLTDESGGTNETSVTADAEPAGTPGPLLVDLVGVASEAIEPLRRRAGELLEQADRPVLLLIDSGTTSAITELEGIRHYGVIPTDGSPGSVTSVALTAALDTARRVFDNSAAQASTYLNAVASIVLSGEDVTVRRRTEETLRRRLRYEQGVNAASQVLVERHGSLSEALQHIRDATGMDRVYIFENSTNADGELCMSQLAEAHAQSVVPQLDNSALQELPYSALTPEIRSLLEQGKFFDRNVRELTAADRELLEAQGIEHLLLIPVAAQGEWLGFLGFDDCRRQEYWEEEEVALFRSLAALIGNSIARHRVEDDLENHLRFRQIAAEVSARFVRRLGRDMDEAVDYLLRAIGTHFAADRAYLLQISADGRRFSNTHEWCARGIEAQLPELRDVPVERVGHLIEPLRRGEVVAIPDMDHLPKDAVAERAHLEQQNIQSLLCIPLSIEGAYRGILGFDVVRGRRRWTKDEIQLTKVVADILAGAFDTERAIAAADWERRLMHTLLETSPDFIAFKDRDQRYLKLSRSVAGALGLGDAREAIGRRAEEFYPPETAAILNASEARILETGEPVVGQEQEVFWPSGGRVCMSVTKLPMYDNVGRIIGTFSIGRDITVQKDAEHEVRQLLAEKETLLQEVHHRIKNNMASMDSLLSLQAQMARHKEAQEALENAHRRLQSMEVLYERLYRSGGITRMSLSGYLSSLIEQILQLNAPDPELHLDSDFVDAELDVHTLSVLGMIINELLTNTLKHAFPAGAESGQKRISLRAKIEDAGTLVLEYQDTGRGIPREVLSGEHSGLGMVLIRSLTDQLDGTFEARDPREAQGGLEPRREAAGTHLVFRIPLRDNGKNET